jgi:hypothetical protein
MADDQGVENAPDILIYGAYGYSGQLVVREAVKRGLRPKVAGRDPRRTAAVAARFGLDWVAVSLDDEPGLNRALSDFAVVAHCAGPFERTAAPMVEACLRTGTHYLDLTGEADVFAAIYARHDDAVEAGVALVPGAGFDVVARYVRRRASNGQSHDLQPGSGTRGIEGNNVQYEEHLRPLCAEQRATGLAWLARGVDGITPQTEKRRASVQHVSPTSLTVS